MRLDSSRIGSQLTRLWWGGQQQQFSRVGGWQALACLNPAMHKASDAGHIEPHGMRRCLSFSYSGARKCRRPPPPEAKKRLFLKSAWCAKNIANTVKNGPWEGLVCGKGRNPKKAEHQQEIVFFSDFLLIFDVTFFCVKI